MQDIIDELQNVKTNTRSTERRACMTQLIRLARDGNSVIIKEKFRYGSKLEANHSYNCGLPFFFPIDSHT